MAIFAAQSAIMWKERIPGFLLVLGLGIAATLLAPFIPGTNEVLLGLILGVLAGNLRPLAPSLDKGVAFAGAEGLNLSVIFLGFGISFGDIQGLGGGMVALAEGLDPAGEQRVVGEGCGSRHGLAGMDRLGLADENRSQGNGKAGPDQHDMRASRKLRLNEGPGCWNRHHSGSVVSQPPRNVATAASFSKR